MQGIQLLVSPPTSIDRFFLFSQFEFSICNQSKVWHRFLFFCFSLWGQKREHSLVNVRSVTERDVQQICSPSWQRCVEWYFEFQMHFRLNELAGSSAKGQVAAWRWNNWSCIPEVGRDRCTNSTKVGKRNSERWNGGLWLKLMAPGTKCGIETRVQILSPPDSSVRPSGILPVPNGAEYRGPAEESFRPPFRAIRDRAGNWGAANFENEIQRRVSPQIWPS